MGLFSKLKKRYGDKPKEEAPILQPVVQEPIAQKAPVKKQQTVKAIPKQIKAPQPIERESPTPQQENVPRSIYFLIIMFFLVSIAIVVKGLMIKEQFIAYIAVGYLATLMMCFIFIFLLLMNKKLIINNLKMILMKGVGHGKVIVLQPNGYLNVYIKKFCDDGFRIKGEHYKFNRQRVYNDIDGEKCIYFRQGDVEPLDLILDEIPLIDGKLYAQDLDKAMSAGALSVQKGDNDYALIASVASAILSLGCAMILLKLYGDVSEILRLVTP